MSPGRQSSSSKVLIGLGGVVGLCAAAVVLMKKCARTKGGAPKLPIEVRREKVADAAQRFGSTFAKVPVITAVDAQRLLQEQPEQYVVVDCRNKEEQEVSMLPGSRVLTASEYEQHREDRYKDATAICYCTVGYRSSMYASSLMDQGQQAFNLQGGIVGWTHAELPLVDGCDRQQATSRVHTYSQKWAFQADGYEPVYYANSNFVMLRDVLGTLKGALLGG